jgi:hypothetical protein
MAAKSPASFRQQRKEDLNEKLAATVLSGKVQMVKKFLSAGSDPNYCTSSGNTMLTLASKCPKDSRFLVMKELLSKGANIDAYNDNGLTALLLAARNGDLELVRFLIENDASLALEDSEGNSSLALAALGGHVDVTRLLIEEYKVHNLNIDKKNMLGLTPLLMASQNGFLDTCKLLVCNGHASITIRDLDNFMTAEDWLRTTTTVSDSELTFLTRGSVRKKKIVGRQTRAKLLSDYLDSGTIPSPTSHNVYTFRHCDEKVPNEQLKSISLPAILHEEDSSVSDRHCANSMFDIPKKGNLSQYKSVNGDWNTSHEVPVLGSKTKVFETACIAKRRVAPTKYTPNRQAHGLASGSLKPLHSDHTPKKKQDHFRNASVDLPQIHKKPLPPIKKISRPFEQ